MAAVATLILLLTVSIAGAEEALLRNPSFEDPMDPVNAQCDIAAAWIRWGQWMNRETGWFPTKTGDCLVGYHHWKINGPENSGFAQDVPEAQGGKYYTFSIYTYLDPGTDAQEIKVRMEGYHGGATLITQTYSVKALKPGEWVPLSAAAVAPSGGIRVIVFVEPKKKGDRRGAIKFDDASLEASN
ncbi:MAG: hypothetical protein V1873_02080 [Verrucomicrobiota bacterium]